MVPTLVTITSTRVRMSVDHMLRLKVESNNWLKMNKSSEAALTTEKEFKTSNKDT